MEDHRAATIAGLLLAVFMGSCIGGPDELELTFGQGLREDSSLEGWQFREGAESTVGLGFVWYLRPRKVEVVNPVIEPLRWVPEPAVERLQEELDPPVLLLPPPTTPPDTGGDDDTAVDQVTGALQAFDAFGLATKILLALAICWLGFIYRAKVSHLIPGRRKP